MGKSTLKETRDSNRYDQDNEGDREGTETDNEEEEGDISKEVPPPTQGLRVSRQSSGRSGRRCRSEVLPAMQQVSSPIVLSFYSELDSNLGFGLAIILEFEIPRIITV
ncbi:hypothetical protein NE237_018549 [Protea cynaroides]|uniref:Uncharacterized protein n=1 Tax=Protea cynaroides TaxID=273540 RepID=A0A9Q0QP13_9MAGN|nr:hypothetical protein NE237_018549 [Protea cynaroides]